MPSSQVAQILSYTNKMLREHSKSNIVAQFVLKVVQTISVPECHAIWAIKESHDLIEALFDTLFKCDSFENGKYLCNKARSS